MYQLTENNDFVLCLDTGAWIARGTWLWDVYEQWLAAGNTPQPVPTVVVPEPTREELVARTKQLMTELLDSTVQQRGYDDIVSCVSYIGDPNPRFDAEARAARDWRSAVYTFGYEVLAMDPLPDHFATPEGVISFMPSIEWPE